MADPPSRSHKNQVYQAGFRSLNPSGNNSLHMQNNTRIAATLPDVATPTDISVKHEKNDPKKLIPEVIGAVLGVIAAIICLIVFIIWKRNQRERKRWKAALERRAKRKAKKPGDDNGHRSNHSATLLGSVTSATKSWNRTPAISAAPVGEGAGSGSSSGDIKEKEAFACTTTEIPINDCDNDAALARKLQRKYDAAHERAIQNPDSHDRQPKERVQSPQPPGYDTVSAGTAMDMYPVPEANRVSHFAPALGPDRFRRPSSVTHDVDNIHDETLPPPPPPPPVSRGANSKSPIRPWRDADEYILPQSPPPPRDFGSPSGWRDTLVEDGNPNNAFVFPAPSPPQRPLPARPVHSPTIGWRDTAPPDRPLPERPGMRSPQPVRRNADDV